MSGNIDGDNHAVPVDSSSDSLAESVASRKDNASRADGRRAQTNVSNVGNVSTIIRNTGESSKITVGETSTTLELAGERDVVVKDVANRYHDIDGGGKATEVDIKGSKFTG